MTVQRLFSKSEKPRALINGGAGVKFFSADRLLLGVGAGTPSKHSLINVPLITS
jgi:hypothetical protein